MIKETLLPGEKRFEPVLESHLWMRTIAVVGGLTVAGSFSAAIVVSIIGLYLWAAGLLAVSASVYGILSGIARLGERRLARMRADHEAVMGEWHALAESDFDELLGS